MAIQEFTSYNSIFIMIAVQCMEFEILYTLRELSLIALFQQNMLAITDGKLVWQPLCYVCLALYASNKKFIVFC